ncbi:MAG TPA: hypothetical protein DCS09_00715 [Porphyromonadaceae bacterium]|nr:hypothetical protein [Porphyromonadaceae bacterium]HBB02080.1 hypothetical protein [Porphyromonadaceae bacterium]HCC17762.1 hypothetical protein [Porphyromonadaceae bacterium]
MNKRIIMVLTCSMLVVTLCAQTSLNALYNEFAGELNASTVNLNGLAMMMGKPFLEKHSDSKISDIRVLSLDECTKEVKDRFNEQALRFMDKRYELFVSSNEPDEKVRIFLKFQDNMIREMVIITMGDTPELVLLKGKIKPSDIENLGNGGK